MGLISIAEAKQVATLAALADAVLTALIATASARLEKWCRRSFLSAERTERHSGKGQRSLWLRQFPVTKVSRVILYDDYEVVDQQYDVKGSDVAPVGFRVNLRTGELRWFDGAFTVGFENIFVTYTAGFSAVPEDVKEGCILLCAYIYERRRQDLAIVSESLGDYSYRLREEVEGELPPEVWSQVGAYRAYRA